MAKKTFPNTREFKALGGQPGGVMAMVLRVRLMHTTMVGWDRGGGTSEEVEREEEWGVDEAEVGGEDEHEVVPVEHLAPGEALLARETQQPVDAGQPKGV